MQSVCLSNHYVVFQSLCLSRLTAVQEHFEGNWVLEVTKASSCCELLVVGPPCTVFIRGNYFYHHWRYFLCSFGHPPLFACGHLRCNGSSDTTLVMCCSKRVFQSVFTYVKTSGLCGALTDCVIQNMLLWLSGQFLMNSAFVLNKLMVSFVNRFSNESTSYRRLHL